MEARKLGRANIEVGVIGFGGIPIQRLSQEAAINTIRLAAEEGINFIDTARAYGDSEKLIGMGIAGNRRHWTIATKTMAKTYDDMKKDIEISLSNLHCGTIDLYQTHLVKTKEQYDQIMGPEGAYKALLEAQQEGKIREIGLTTHSVDILELAIEEGHFSTVQFPYNAVEQQAEEAFKKAKEKNIGVIVMKPLAGGALSNGNLALRFILENPNVSVVIPGIDKLEQVKENASIGKSFTPLTEVERQELKTIKDELGVRFCRRCGYCMPCPQNIDIPTQFLMVGYYTRYELKDWAMERYAGLPQKASDCTKCGACEKRCPYDLPIRDMLDEVITHLGK